MTAVLTEAHGVHEVLSRNMLVDGFDFVLDLAASAGSWLVDARDGRRYLDMFTFFASSALGMNHPALADDEDFRAELTQAALNKPSNADVYTVAMAGFVDTFARVLGDPALREQVGMRAGEHGLGEVRAGARCQPPRLAVRAALVREAGHDHRPGALGVDVPLGLHAVADQHEARHRGALPEIRLAAHRRAICSAGSRYARAGSRVAAAGPRGF